MGITIFLCVKLYFYQYFTSDLLVGTGKYPDFTKKWQKLHPVFGFCVCFWFSSL